MKQSVHLHLRKRTMTMTADWNRLGLLPGIPLEAAVLRPRCRRHPRPSLLRSTTVLTAGDVRGLSKIGRFCSHLDNVFSRASGHITYALLLPSLIFWIFTLSISPTRSINDVSLSFTVSYLPRNFNHPIRVLSLFLLVSLPVPFCRGDFKLLVILCITASPKSNLYYF
jgi:hypothetical protein